MLEAKSLNMQTIKILIFERWYTELWKKCIYMYNICIRGFYFGPHAELVSLKDLIILTQVIT